MNKEELAEIYHLANERFTKQYSLLYNDEYYQTYEAVPMAYAPYRPKAGAIVNAFANYRLSHPLVRWYYKIKELSQWRINIKLYKGD
tara:strand:- start:190 stop:450 length:261 start_codon:yes stop_codon:yes gene_type:complete